MMEQALEHAPAAAQHTVHATSHGQAKRSRGAQLDP
jgi:hypothetical protein